MMLVLRSPDVDPVTLDRLLRDGAVSYLAFGASVPRDVHVTASLRTLAVAPLTTHHTVVSGAAGLWIHAGGVAPAHLDVVGDRGAHRIVPPADTPPGVVRFHSGPAHSEPGLIVAGVRVASAARCALDTLRWDPVAWAVPRVLGALRDEAVDVTAIDESATRDDARGTGAARLASLWSELRRVAVS